MEGIDIKLSYKFAGIFSCFSLLIIGTLCLYKQNSFTLTSVIYTCQIAFSGAIIAGICGYFIGNVLDTVDLESLRTGNDNNVLDSELSESHLDNNKENVDV